MRSECASAPGLQLLQTRSSTNTDPVSGSVDFTEAAFTEALTTGNTGNTGDTQEPGQTPSAQTFVMQKDQDLMENKQMKWNRADMVQEMIRILKTQMEGFVNIMNLFKSK